VVVVAVAAAAGEVDTTATWTASGVRQNTLLASSHVQSMQISFASLGAPQNILIVREKSAMTRRSVSVTSIL